MPPAVIASTGIQKPELGQPCNGCGYCCESEPCQLAVDIIGEVTAPCPALETSDGIARCGIVVRPAWYMFGEDVAPNETTGRLSCLFAAALGIGRGCDSLAPTNREAE